jgi:diguanylate cyclase (GGDEF)-like protein
VTAHQARWTAAEPGPDPVGSAEPRYGRSGAVRAGYRLLTGRSSDEAWRARPPFLALAVCLVFAVAVTLASSAIGGGGSTAVELWLAVIMIVGTYRFALRAVLPVAAVAAMAELIPRHPPLSVTILEQGTAIAACYVGLGLASCWAFRLAAARMLRSQRQWLAEAEQARRAADTLADEQVRLRQQLEHSATHDGLTGLVNRVAFLDLLRAQLASGPADPTACAVVVVGLDGFRQVNEEYGHDAGDEVLRTIAQRLEAAVREGDTVARLGGDEFVVLLVELPSSVAPSLVERLVGTVEAPIGFDERSIGIRVSAGLAYAEGSPEPLELLEKASYAMSAAKLQGTSSIAVYEPRMREQTTQRRQLAHDLKQALDQEQLRVAYQPMISLVDGSVAGFEALLRWQHPEFGWVSPDLFIPLAEANGSILVIGQWVLEQACRQLRVWTNISQRLDLKMAVNLSARQLAEPRLVGGLWRTVSRAGVDPRNVILEVTESLAMDDNAVTALCQLRGVGLRLAVDDFGTGYSSLSRLAALPLDKLKVDKSFIAPLSKSADATKAALLLRSTVAMAHGLGLKVVAEGVERVEDVALLRHVGCDLAQGYFFSQPRLAQDLDVSTLWPLPPAEATLLGWAADPGAEDGDPIAYGPVRLAMPALVPGWGLAATPPAPPLLPSLPRQPASHGRDGFTAPARPTDAGGGPRSNGAGR